jgi:2-oxoglutarate ferredoxin oxidoreductase subunit alpha
MTKKNQLNDVVIRLAGDSGDGMQLIGTELANASAIMGNDIGTLPDFPAEIRAPRGTVAGVSGFQINIGAHDIHTPGDDADCLVALNPAALKSNISYLKANGVLIVDTNSFDDKGLKYADYSTNPLEDGSLAKFQIIKIDITTNNRKALEGLPLSHKDIDRCKNYYTYGVICWLYSRNYEHAIETLKHKFAKKPDIMEANILALKAGYVYGDVTETYISQSEIQEAHLEAGKYRSITGTQALVYGLLAGAEKSGLNILYSGYPITPASEILHELFKMQHFNVKIVQAEDEIAAAGIAIGASFAGSLGVTASSGPGLMLKMEAISLAVMTELPMIVINVQRGGPSTGLPTKTEQADLLQALFGRSGEAHLPVIAAFRPNDCFETTIEAIKIAVKYRTPVIILSDAYIANGSEPWIIPDLANIPIIDTNLAKDLETYKPYKRNEKSLAREWAIPGMPGFEHRIGGLEKKENDGSVNYSPENHHAMTRIRFEKIERIADDMSPLYVDGPSSGDLLVLGWGSTYGAIRTAVEKIRTDKSDKKLTHIHLKWVNPMHPDLVKYIKNFKHIIIPEMNLGQLLMLVRAKYLVEAEGLNMVRGLPYTSKELIEKFMTYLG